MSTLIYFWEINYVIFPLRIKFSQYVFLILFNAHTRLIWSSLLAFVSLYIALYLENTMNWVNFSEFFIHSIIAIGATRAPKRRCQSLHWHKLWQSPKWLKKSTFYHLLIFNITHSNLNKNCVYKALFTLFLNVEIGNDVSRAIFLI